MKIQVQVPDATWDAFKAIAEGLNVPCGHFLDMVLRRALDSDDWDFSDIAVKPPGQWGKQKLAKGESWMLDPELGWRVRTSRKASAVTKAQDSEPDPWE